MTGSDMNTMAKTFELGSETCTDFVDEYEYMCCEFYCTNTVGWVDAVGNECDWYETNDLPGCPSSNATKDNCCYCGKVHTRKSTSTVGRSEAKDVPIENPTSGGVAFSGFGVFALVSIFWEVYAIGFL